MKQFNHYISSFFLVCCLHVSFQASATPGKQFQNNRLTHTIDSLSTLSWQTRELDPDSALKMGLKALAMAEENNLTNIIAQTSNYVGAIHSHYLYKYRKAIPYFRKALEVSLTTNDSVQIGYAYNNLCHVYLAIGNTTLALKYGRFALEIFKQIEHQPGMAYAYTSIGSIHRVTGDYQKALENFKTASEIRNILSSRARQGSALYNVAKTYEASGKLDTAMYLYKKALGEDDASKDARYGAICLHGIGNIHYAYGQYEQALMYYNKSLEWERLRKNGSGIIDNYIGIAMIHAHNNEHVKGDELLNKAVELARNLEMESQLINAYAAYIEFYKIIGDYKKVEKSYETYLEEYKSILAMQQIEIVNELERNFNMKIDLNQTEKELETNKRLRFRLITIIILMLSIMAVLVWEYLEHKRMNKQLEEMNKTKDKLFSVISHDLRNPFNGLVGFSEILVEELKDNENETAKKCASFLYQSSQEGLNLLNNLLNWSMSQTGRIKFTPEHVDFNTFFVNLENLFHTQAQKYNVNLTFKNHLKTNVSVDPNIVKIILVNLITNAFKYTDEKGNIHVCASKENSFVQIKVEDTGIGMPEDTVHKLFGNNNFMKSKKGLRQEKGSGLGLNIVHELVHVHKGKITVKSVEGSGSTFTLILPFMP